MKVEYLVINWEGFNARKACATYASNPHKDSFMRALWQKGWQDADSGLSKPESVK